MKYLKKYESIKDKRQYENSYGFNVGDIVHIKNGWLKSAYLEIIKIKNNGGAGQVVFKVVDTFAGQAFEPSRFTKGEIVSNCGILVLKSAHLIKKGSEPTEYNRKPNDIKEDLEDILMELEDIGIDVDVYDNSILGMVVGKKHSPKDYDEDYDDHYDPKHDDFEIESVVWDAIKYPILEVKDYLGDNFVYFFYQKILHTKVGKRNVDQILMDEIKVELNENTEIKDSIWAFGIKYKK